MLLMYNYVLLKMSTWYSKHVEVSNNIWRINNIQCITLVVLYGQIRQCGCIVIHSSLCSVRVLRCTLNYTHHKQDWITMQPHCRTVFNDMFQLTILMFIILAKHKRRAPWWRSFWTETCRSILMVILMYILIFFLEYLIVHPLDKINETC